MKNQSFIPRASPRGEVDGGATYYPGMLKISPNSGFTMFKKPQNLMFEDRNNNNNNSSNNNPNNSNNNAENIDHNSQ